MTSVQAYGFLQPEKLGDRGGDAVVHVPPPLPFSNNGVVTSQHHVYAVKAFDQNGSFYKQEGCVFRNHFNIHWNRPVLFACAIKK